MNLDVTISIREFSSFFNPDQKIEFITWIDKGKHQKKLKYYYKGVLWAIVTHNGLSKKEKRKIRHLIYRKIIDNITHEFKKHIIINSYLANISHEIATPLNSIIGTLSLLEDTYLNAIQKEYIEIMKKSSFILMNLISDIIDISRLESGKLRLTWSAADISEIIESTYAITKTYAEGKNIKFTYSISSDISTIVTDVQRLKQIFINLLSNAFKYTEKGSVSVKVTLSSEHLSIPNVDNFNKTLEVKRMGELKCIQCSVKDTGIGIPDKDKDKIFNPYEQIGMKRKYPGVGLGLTITKRICEAMGGKIWFESKENEGTIFYFILPIREYDKNAVIADPKILVGKKALIVDDKEQNLLQICTILDKYNIDHQECISSRRAYINYIESGKYKFDIGFIDIYMPEIDGNTLAGYINSSSNPFPLIALSSANANVQNNQFITVLNKPYTEEQIINALLSIFGKEKVRASIIPNICILVVEDNLFNQKMMVKLLNSLGYYDIDVANNGKIACKKIKKKDYDFIFMDIIMPVMSGIEATNYINNYYFEKKKKRPKIIAVTGHISEEDKHKFLEDLKMDSYIIKPIETKEKIREVINNIKDDRHKIL